MHLLVKSIYMQSESTAVIWYYDSVKETNSTILTIPQFYNSTIVQLYNSTTLQFYDSNNSTILSEHE